MVRTDGESCRIMWDPGRVSLADLSVLTSYMVDVYTDLARPVIAEQYGSHPSALEVNSIGMASPLSIEVVTQFGDPVIGALTLGAFGYIVKHPEAIGGWLGRLQVGWYGQRRDALLEKDRYLRAKAELTVQGEPVLAFEREVLPELLRRPPEREADFEAGS